MADDDIDHELIALLRASLLGGQSTAPVQPETRVLKDAEFIYNNAIDVAVDFLSTRQAASFVWNSMQQQEYSTKTWSAHELHPKEKNEATVAFIFTMDLLNFSFWQDDEDSEVFTVEYADKQWTGYWSLVAALRRALDEGWEGIPVTDPHFWVDENECRLDTMLHIFRSSTSSEMPLLDERLTCLRRAGKVLYEKYQCSFLNCLKACSHSAANLVNELAQNFDVFRDEATFEGRSVQFYKRAQILVADLWACFDGEGYGQFDDIDKITMFADYRVPQMLHGLGCLQYNPTLSSHIAARKPIEPGHAWEVQLRGCSIWCVELLRREILKQHPEAHVNAILIDFFLYDTVKKGDISNDAMLPHHRTRCIWY